MTIFYTQPAKTSAPKHSPSDPLFFLLSDALIRLYNILQNSFIAKVRQHSGVNKTPHSFSSEASLAFSLFA